MKQHLYRGLIIACLMALITCIYCYIALPQEVWQSLALALLMVWLIMAMLVLLACRAR